MFGNNELKFLEGKIKKLEAEITARKAKQIKKEAILAMRATIDELEKELKSL